MSLGYLTRSLPINWYGAIGATIYQPKIAEMNNAIHSLLRDMTAHTPTLATAAPGLIRNYQEFTNEWELWRQAHDSRIELGVNWLDLPRALEGFIDRYNAYERQYRQLVGLPSNPGSERDPVGEAAGLPTWAWTLIVIGAVGVGGYALYALSRVLREGRMIAEGGGGMRGLGGRQRWAVYEIIKVPSWEYEDEEELDLVRVTRPVTTRAAAMRQMRKLERETGGPGGAKYAVHGAGKGLDGLRGPRRVSDLDGRNSTYNLEIDR